MALDFSLHSVPFYTDDPKSCKPLPNDTVLRAENDWWGDRLLRKGVDAKDVEFLVQVLNPDPNERLSAEDIIRSEYLEI